MEAKDLWREPKQTRQEFFTQCKYNLSHNPVYYYGLLFFGLSSCLILWGIIILN